MSLKHEICKFAREIEAQDNAAFDLWTWMPSYKAAQKAHGDYASEHQPSHADLMKETAMFLSELRGHEHTDAECEEWFGCPCGECEHAKGVRPTLDGWLKQ
jgi:hypothetical protein